MERNAILAKTPKGQDEVKTRTHRLDRKLRSVLIMVDGSATVGDVLAKCEGIAEAEAMLASLVNQGFVETKGSSAAAGAPAAAPRAPPAGTAQPLPNPAAPGAPSPDTTQPLPNPAVGRAPPLGATQPIPISAAPAQSSEAAMDALQRFLAGHIGATDALSDALRRARTRADFHAVAEHCAHALAAARGASEAQAFRERARGYLDACFGAS